LKEIIFATAVLKALLVVIEYSQCGLCDAT